MKRSEEALRELRAMRDRGIGEAMRLELLGHDARAEEAWAYVEFLTVQAETLEASLELPRSA